jgi:hypothetical protein
MARRASREFIPDVRGLTPRRMPSHRSTSSDSSSLPFRPSARSRVPTMPSADFCGAVREDSSTLSPAYRDNQQISQGKTQSCPCVGAGFIKHTHPRMEDFVVTYPLVPTVPHLISGSCPSPRTFVPRFLQTPPRGDALALPWSFGSTNTWTGDFHPQA